MRCIFLCGAGPSDQLGLGNFELEWVLWPGGETQSVPEISQSRPIRQPYTFPRRLTDYLHTEEYISHICQHIFQRDTAPIST